MALQASRRSISQFRSASRACSAQRWRFSTSAIRRIDAIKVDSTSPSEAPLSEASIHAQSQSPTLSDVPTRAPSSRTEKSPSTLPRYHVSRTPSNNLPVYQDIRNGGTRKETIVRKLAGDAGSLRDELRILLGVEDERVWVGKVTGHVYVKGHHKPAIEKFLAEKGF